MSRIRTLARLDRDGGGGPFIGVPRGGVCPAAHIGCRRPAMKSAANLRSILDYHEEDGEIVAPSKVRDARAHD